MDKGKNPDEQMALGASVGESFRSRGIGLDSCACFICGTRDRDGKGHTMLHNIAAFVSSKASGERVVAMFKRGARLDWREYEPDRIQVKVGACDTHLPNLRRLDQLCSGEVIMPEVVNLLADNARLRVEIASWEQRLFDVSVAMGEQSGEMANLRAALEVVEVKNLRLQAREMRLELASERLQLALEAAPKPPEGDDGGKDWLESVGEYIDWYEEHVQGKLKEG